MGGVVSAAARTVVETPFELMKVRLQTGGSGRASGGASLLSTAQLAELYTGAGPTFYRATLMLGSFFVLCDYFERFAPELMAVPPPGGSCQAASWQRRGATALPSQAEPPSAGLLHAPERSGRAHQISTRSPPDLHQISTRSPPDLHQISTRSP